MADSARTAEVTETITAPPDRVWDLVSDVTRMGEWSPETTSCRWVGGAKEPVIGARFIGVNKHRWRVWATMCRVTEAERGRSFAFDVTFGPMPVATWRYEITPDGAGCVVRESWVDRRPRAFAAVYPVVMGVPDRAEHNRDGMAATLRALKSAAEA